jgi:hypothetical protein
MHTGISVMWSPYANGDLRDPRCIWGLILIPVCIRGLCVMQSLYAYGDLWYPRMHTGIDLNPHMHMGIAWHIISIWIWGYHLSLYAYGDWFWSLYAYRNNKEWLAHTMVMQYPAVRYVGVGAVTSTTGGLHVNQSVPALGTERWLVSTLVMYYLL